MTSQNLKPEYNRQELIDFVYDEKKNDEVKHYHDIFSAVHKYFLVKYGDGHPFFTTLSFTTRRLTLLGIAREIFNDVKQDIDQHQEEKRREYEQARLQAAQLQYNNAKIYVRTLARTHKKKHTLKQIAALQQMERFRNKQDILNQLYNEYATQWDAINAQQVQPRPSVSREKPFKQRIDDYVTLHPDDLLDFDQFKAVIRTWNRNMSEEQAYKYYKNAFFKVPGVNIQVDEPQDLTKLGFKNVDKYKYGLEDYELKPVIEESIVNSFPLTENIKKYKLHKLAPRGTYMIDLMFGSDTFKNLTYLVAINVNTRYVCIELTNIPNDSGEFLKNNTKTTTSYLRALTKIMNAVRDTQPIKYLTGDGESAFASILAQAFYREHGITFHPVPRMSIPGKKSTDPLHSSLGLIDRFIRTLRDMLYQAGYETTPKAIQEMVRQYNNAPHKSLSKWIGFDVSPSMVQNDRNMEEFITTKIYKANIATKINTDFDLQPGTKVKVYNEKNVLGKRRTICIPGIIRGMQGSLYKVEIQVNGQTKIELVPRYKITHYL